MRGTSEDILATRGATAAAPPNLLMLKTYIGFFYKTEWFGIKI